MVQVTNALRFSTLTPCACLHRAQQPSGNPGTNRRQTDHCCVCVRLNRRETNTSKTNMPERQEKTKANAKHGKTFTDATLTANHKFNLVVQNMFSLGCMIIFVSATRRNLVLQRLCWMPGYETLTTISETNSANSGKHM